MQSAVEIIPISAAATPTNSTNAGNQDYPQSIAGSMIQLLPLVLLFHVCDGIQGTASGILKACGKHKFVAFGYVFAFYILAFPIGTRLAFFWGLKLSGLWIGMCCGVGLLTVAQVAYIVHYMNWKRVAILARGSSSFATVLNGVSLEVDNKKI